MFSNTFYEDQICGSFYENNHSVVPATHGSAETSHFFYFYVILKF